MIFAVDTAVFDSAINDFDRSRLLASLVDLGGREPHAIYPVDGCDGVCGRWLAGCGRHAQLYRLTLQDGTAQASRASSRKARASVIAGPSDFVATPRRLSLVDAEALVRMPLSIWLEDNDSDRGFLERAIGQKLCSRLRKLEGEPVAAVRFEHGGGAVILRQLQSLQPLHAARSWAMIDSDREAVDAPEPTKVSNIRSACASKGIELRVLARREVENYLPLPILEWWARNETTYNTEFSAAERSSKVLQFGRHPPDLRFFVDMKSHFGRRCAKIFQDNGPAWRQRLFADDGSQDEFEAIRSSLEERL